MAVIALQPSKTGPSIGPVGFMRWSDVHKESKPACSASSAASRRPGQSLICGQRSAPNFSPLGARSLRADLTAALLTIDAPRRAVEYCGKFRMFCRCERILHFLDDGRIFRHQA